MLQRDSENSAKTIHDCSDALLLGSLHDVQELPSGHFPRWKKQKTHTHNIKCFGHITDHEPHFSHHHYCCFINHSFNKL